MASLSAGAGAAGAGDLAAAGSHGRLPKNMSRDMMRALLKDCTWPDVYWAKIPVANANQEKEYAWLPVLLPHEVLAMLVDKVGVAYDLYS
eukprot:6928447-Alexandrium_andersonii.AAC.1